MDKNLQIANYLMLKSISIRNISLYHGKTGILLALYLFSHQEEKENIKEYAWDLLQDIHKDINETLPLGLEYGLAGIGLGMTLLKSHGIIDCDLNDLLYDIDQQIMMYDPRRFTDFSFRNGALGIKHYIEQRLVVEQELLSFGTFYLTSVMKITPNMTVFTPIMEDERNPNDRLYSQNKTDDLYEALIIHIYNVLVFHSIIQPTTYSRHCARWLFESAPARSTCDFAFSG